MPASWVQCDSILSIRSCLAAHPGSVGTPARSGHSGVVFEYEVCEKRRDILVHSTAKAHADDFRVCWPMTGSGRPLRVMCLPPAPADRHFSGAHNVTMKNGLRYSKFWKLTNMQNPLKIFRIQNLWKNRHQSIFSLVQYVPAERSIRTRIDPLTNKSI